MSRKFIKSLQGLPLSVRHTVVNNPGLISRNNVHSSVFHDHMFRNPSFYGYRESYPGRHSSTSEHRLRSDLKGSLFVQRFYHPESPFLNQTQKTNYVKGDGTKRAVQRFFYLTVAISGLCITIVYTKSEIIPYTYRRHFVLVSPDYEISLATLQFKALKEEWKSLILPPFHPETVRVRRIAKHIIKAVLEGTQLEGSDTLQLKYEGRLRPHLELDDRNVFTWMPDSNLPISTQWGRQDEILDDQWMDKTRKKGLKKGSKPYVEHLKKTKWEVLVIDKDVINAFCLPGGKIVVYTGLLKNFPYDEDIATVLGHEVAHVVARHSAERMTRYLYVTLAELFVLAFYPSPNLVQSASILFLELPFSRRQELEADHIGLLLMAAAGYDPRFAPGVYEKLGKLSGSDSLEWLQYVTTHPSGKKRGERLRDTGTMDQALRIYYESTQGNIIEGFLRLLQ